MNQGRGAFTTRGYSSRCAGSTRRRSGSATAAATSPVSPGTSRCCAGSTAKPGRRPRPRVLFRAAPRRMLADRVVLPGENVLTRLVEACGNAPPGDCGLASLMGRHLSSWTHWKASWWCRRASGARSWTDSGIRRSAPASAVWSKPRAPRRGPRPGRRGPRPVTPAAPAGGWLGPLCGGCLGHPARRPRPQATDGDPGRLRPRAHHQRP